MSEIKTLANRVRGKLKGSFALPMSFIVPVSDTVPFIIIIVSSFLFFFHFTFSRYVYVHL